MPFLASLVLSIFVGGAPLEVHLHDVASHSASPALAGASGHIWPSYFELDNQLFIQAMQDLHATAYRFPGGTVANGYDVLTGLMYPNLRYPAWGIYNERHPDGLTIPNYVQLTDTFKNPRQQFVINCLSVPNADGSGDGVVTATVQEYQTEALRLQPFLSNMISEGFNPSYIEFTNELYLPMYNKFEFDKTVEDYENRMNAFSPMLRSIFPNTPFAAVIPLSEKYRNKAGPDGDLGNLEFWEIDPSIDFQAIVLHAYVIGTSELKQYIEFNNNSLEDVMTNWMVQTELGLAASMEYAQNMYPTKEVWMTEWGILISNIDGEVYEPILRNCTLVSMQAASMFVEMLKYDSIEIANHHGMVPMLRPVYDENDNLLKFDRTTHGDITAHMNELLSKGPTVLETTVVNVGEVTAPIVDPNGNGWGTHSVSSISAVLVETDDTYHWIGVNRSADDQEVALNLGDLNISAADVQVYQFYTDALLPKSDPFFETLDLFQPATQETIVLTLANGMVQHALPGMGFVDVRISFAQADANQDWAINMQDILSIIGAWGCSDCQEDIDGSGTVDVGDILTVIAAL